MNRRWKLDGRKRCHGCGGKIVRTKGNALRTAAIMRKANDFDGADRINAYLCKYGHWHVGRRPASRPQERSTEAA